MVLFAGGLGMPGFSTDSATAQRAHEIDATIFKATTVGGVYDKDPKKNPDAVKYERITHRQAISERLGVMDSTAFAMCERTNTPIFVFNIRDLSRLPEAIRGDYSFGTLIEG